MRLLCLAFLVSLAVPTAAAAQPAAAPAQGESARAEIERILEADNLDSSRLTPREVANIIAGIERGRAPNDFWEAYQTHVRAWQLFADAYERAVRQQGESTFVEGEEELAAAGRAIDSTFDEVLRIARRYGARIPAPLNLVPTI